MDLDVVLQELSGEVAAEDAHFDKESWGQLFASRDEQCCSSE